MTRARQVANFDPALFAADEVSGDKVSGGTIGAGTIGGSTIVNTSGAITTTGGMTVDGATVFNEASADVDFRIEGNGEANLFVVDAGNDRIGIGTATPSYMLHVTGSDSGETHVEIENTSADDNGCTLRFSKNSASPADNDRIGSIDFYGRDDGNNELNYGSVYVNSTDVSDGDEDSTMFFGTREGSTWKTTMALVGSKVAMGTSTATGDTNALQINYTGGSENDPLLTLYGDADNYVKWGLWKENNQQTCKYKLGTTATRNILDFHNSSGAQGYIQMTTSAVTYNSISDYRVKENIVPMTGSIDRIKSLKPSRFNFKQDPSKTVDGLIAHELSEIIPQAVSGEKDAMRTETYEVSPATESKEAVMGEREVIDPQGVDYGKITPLLVGALQEIITRIEALENA